MPLSIPNAPSAEVENPTPPLNARTIATNTPSTTTYSILLRAKQIILKKLKLPVLKLSHNAAFST